MKTGKLRIMFYALVAMTAGGMIYLMSLYRFEKTVTGPPTEQRIQATAKKDQVKTKTHLYFADKENYFLVAEERDLLHADNPVSFGKTIIAALSDGPQLSLMRTLPAGSAPRAFFIDQDKTAYVDLNRFVKENHPGGSRTEMLTIYSIVNSLVLNIQEIDAVKILVEGNELMTLCGHIDLRFPFKANMLLVR